MQKFRTLNTFNFIETMIIVMALFFLFSISYASAAKKVNTAISRQTQKVTPSSTPFIYVYVHTPVILALATKKNNKHVIVVDEHNQIKLLKVSYFHHIIFLSYRIGHHHYMRSINIEDGYSSGNCIGKIALMLTYDHRYLPICTRVRLLKGTALVLYSDSKKEH